MQPEPIRAAVPALAGFALLLAGCGSVSVWPFDSEKGQERSRAPANATAYQCDGGKRLFVRYLDNGASAWVILPEREFRLDKAASASGGRYSNGSATLDTQGNQATLSDGPAIQFTGCKPAAG